MMLKQSFENEFDDLYNQYNNSEKGKLLLEVEGISRRALDVNEMSKDYFSNRISDISIDANANANEIKTYNNYSCEITKGVLKLNGYYLIHHYASQRFGIDRANELLKAIFSGDVYFHDAVNPQIPYCQAFSTSMLMIEGRPYGQLYSKPPKRADTFMAQAIELAIDLSQENVGAIAPSDLLINYAWYSKKENLSDDRIRNDFQKFLFVMNNKFRVSGQSPFSNISIFDRKNLENVFEHYQYPDGSNIDVEYIMHIQKTIGEWFSKGDPITGLPYRFPIITINISCDENKNVIDQEFLEWASNVNTATGCFNIYVNTGEKLASCCRLVNDESRMKFKTDTFGNGGISIGSHRVITINLPRLSLRAKGDKDKFYQELIRCLEISRDLLITHREEILDRRIKQGFLKFYNPLKWFSLERSFSTIGIIGIYEMTSLMGYDIKNSFGVHFATNVLESIEKFAQDVSIQTGHSFNVEEIPGESVASKLCEKDKIVFGKEYVPYKLYSNQYIPLIDDVSIPERIETTGKFMDILSGGGILHLNCKEQITDSSKMKKLIEYSVKHGVSHLAINYGFGICKNKHTTICGNSTICSICGDQIEDWMTRIIGYFAMVSSWNKVRREYEFVNRKFDGELLKEFV